MRRGSANEFKSRFGVLFLLVITPWAIVGEKGIVAEWYPAIAFFYVAMLLIRIENVEKRIERGHD